MLQQARRALLALWLCIAAACTQTEHVEAPTQIMLRISSADQLLVGALSQLRVRVALREGSGFKAPVEKLFPKAQLNWPVDIPIVPRVPDDAFKQFEVVVDALGSGGGVLAQARIIGGFVPRERRVLNLNLFFCPDHATGFVCGAPDCSGDACQVCTSDGQCVAVDSINPDDLQPLEDSVSSDAGGESDASVRTDASVHTDAGRSDAASDAQAASTDGTTPQDASGATDAAPLDAGEAGLDASDAADSASGEASVDASSPDSAAPDAGSFTPVRFSTTDRAERAVLGADRLRVETRGEGIANARSDRAIAPGSGVFYFEAERLIATLGEYGVGVATAAASLTAPLGDQSQSLGLHTFGFFVDAITGCTGSAVGNAQATFDGTLRNFAFVIDYRTNSPRIHMLLGTPAGVSVRRSCNLALTTPQPLYVFYSGGRYEVGAQIAINTGADTTNFPFYFDLTAVKLALTNAGESSAAQALIAGFGGSRAGAVDQPPSLEAPADRSVTAGSTVMLSARATDAEDGDLTGAIVWEDMASLHHAPLTGMGGTFTFTPGIGRHPLRVRVTDSVGRSTEKTVTIEATGTLPRGTPVRLQGDELSAPSVNLSGTGLSVDFREPDRGLRANTPIYGQYWYFEAHRDWPGIASIGVGLTVREAALNPVSIDNPPWCATVFMTGFTTYNLNQRHSIKPEHDHYGFAVDYTREHPRVHILAGGPLAPAGEYIGTIEMNDVWTPLWPFIYGNALSDDSSTPDATLNFGASAFAFNPVNVIGADRAAGIQLRWGPP